MTSGSVEILTLDSAALRGNPLGDPPRRRVPVYLPPGYADDRRRYPVLYCLAGFTGYGETLLNRGAWSEGLDQRLDRLMNQGCPPAIVVMPDCFTRLGGSQYLNSPALGRYEDHLLEELLPAVDARYRTRAGREGRGVFGKSSGGFAALRLGMRHADRFGAVACHSGDLYFEYCYLQDFPRFLDWTARHGGLEAAVEQAFAKPKLGADDFTGIGVLAMAAAYSPAAGQPLNVELPVDLRTGELRPEVWKRWKAHDPVENVEACQENLRSLGLLYLECGTRDEYHLHHGARIFVDRCRRLGIPLQYEEFDDGHRDTAYRYDVSIPRLVRALDGGSAP